MNLVSKWINEIKYLLWLKPVRDALWNFGAYFIVILIGIVTSSILAKNLSTSDYWKIWFITTIIFILSVGIMYWYNEWYWLSLVKKKNEKEIRETIWAWYLIFFKIWFYLWLLTLIITPLLYFIYKDILLVKWLLVINFFSCFSIFLFFIGTTTRHSWKMKVQALYSMIWPILYLIWIYLVNNFYTLTYINSIVLLYLSWIISLIFITLIIKPSLNNKEKNLKEIKKEQRKHWKNLYFWNIFEQSTYNLDKLILWIFSFSNVWYYSLWLMLVQPIWIFSNKITDSFVRKFKDMDFIPKKLFLYNILWWLFCSITLMLIAEKAILIIWKEEYLIIKDFLLLIIWIILVSNFYYIFYYFLYIKWYSKEIKNIIIHKWFINLVWNLVLIPYYWIYWALLATILSNLYGLIKYVHLYNIIIIKQKR